MESAGDGGLVEGIAVGLVIHIVFVGVVIKDSNASKSEPEDSLQRVLLVLLLSFFFRGTFIPCYCADFQINDTGVFIVLCEVLYAQVVLCGPIILDGADSIKLGDELDYGRAQLFYGSVILGLLLSIDSNGELVGNRTTELRREHTHDLDFAFALEECLLILRSYLHYH